MTKNSISSIRAEIASKQDELAWIESAGRPVAESLLIYKMQLDDIAAPYRMAIHRLAGQILLARSEGEIRLHEVLNLTFAPAAFATAAVAELLQNRIASDLQTEIDHLAPTRPEPLEDEAQRQALARLRRELLDLERAEEAMIVAEVERGMVVERRADADPVAVLEIPEGIYAEFAL